MNSNNLVRLVLFFLGPTLTSEAIELAILHGQFKDLEGVLPGVGERAGKEATSTASLSALRTGKFPVQFIRYPIIR